MTVTLKGIELIEEERYINLKITGKLEKEDYDFFVPEIEQEIESHGKVNMLVELINFHGWTAGAVWEDTKFGIRHFNDIKRLGIVGNKGWEKGMAIFCKAFTTAKVRYFDANEKGQREAAESWVKESIER
ncbi:SpoIIAA-like [Nitrosomonas sp. Nm51]|uniref:STAS/SEC14 domain-containing protein n=1 Tax=Nitrosomonas sp. Nm51 TaxID=133720 RepID=UPI0008C512F4|nr:STAS/SEC14 domain-containing protein [Nitrosomonas sp. Nm51]SEQ91071.1 SpoIIAA-like [Nitrosomonas sp. Nm51]